MGMRKVLIVTALGLTFLVAGCKSKTPAANSSNTSAATSMATATAKPADSVDRKLQEIAGTGATNCGRLTSQEADQVQTASSCAMNAAKDKKPFYVGYDLPGLTIAMAGAPDGKLYTVQASQGSEEPKVAPCEAELRVAQSGRVTCTPAGSGMGGAMGGMSPHGGMGMPQGANPHGDMPMANPHGKTPPVKQ